MDRQTKIMVERQKQTQQLKKCTKVQYKDNFLKKFKLPCGPVTTVEMTSNTLKVMSFRRKSLNHAYAWNLFQLRMNVN